MIGSRDSLQLYKSILSNCAESYSQTHLISMIRLLKNICISYQARFWDLLNLENEGYDRLIHIMQEYSEQQEKYYSSLIKSSKYLETLESHYSDKLQNLFSFNGLQTCDLKYSSQILSLWRQSKLVICGIKGRVGKCRPAVVVGFYSEGDSKISKWATIVVNKVKRFFQPIIHEKLDSFIIFYRKHDIVDNSIGNEQVSNDCTGDIGNGHENFNDNLSVDYPGDLNVRGCQIEYSIPFLNNPLYANLIDISREKFYDVNEKFHHPNHFIEYVSENIRNLYTAMQEIEEWLVNYPPWPKSCSGTALTGLVNVIRGSSICSVLLTVHVNPVICLTGGLVKSVRSVTVETPHQVYSSGTREYCGKLQNAIMAHLSSSTTESLVSLVAQSVATML